MLHAPVLQLNMDKMHEVDPRNVENLFGMWTVFSKCASTIPDGKRLENLSWRVWARETLCCPPQPEKTIGPAIDIPLSSREDVPSLCNSYGSDSDQSISSMENSALSKSRGTEPHLTPSALEKIITNIQEQQKIEPLDPEMEACLVAKISPEKLHDLEPSPQSDKSSQPTPNYVSESSCLSTATNTTVDTERDCTHRNSDTSTSSDGLIRSGSVVHGFSPIPSLRSRGNSGISKHLPILARSIGKGPAAVKKAVFTMGGSSEDDESSFDQNMSYRRSMLQAEPRKSSLSTSQTRDDRSYQKKTTSFREEVEQRTIQIGGKSADDNAIESDDDDDEDSVIDDSAIEEDEEEWEDEQPEETPVNPVFKRVDSAALLPSRRSILTAGLTEGDRAKGLLNAASQSSPVIRRTDRAASHTGPLVAVSPDDNDDDGAVMMRPVSNSRAININSQQSSAYALAQSPRTTRRNMLSTELTESLRKNLLWERQQKNTTVNAFLKREARSMANLQRAGQAAQRDQPGPSQTRDDLTRNPNSYNDYFNVTSEYHTKGW